MTCDWLSAEVDSSHPHHPSPHTQRLYHDVTIAFPVHLLSIILCFDVLPFRSGSPQPSPRGSLSSSLYHFCDLKSKVARVQIRLIHCFDLRRKIPGSLPTIIGNHIYSEDRFHIAFLSNTWRAVKINTILKTYPHRRFAAVMSREGL